MNVPAKVWARGRRMKGNVTGEIHQYCACCGCSQSKFIAKWPDGHRTFLCPRGVKFLSNKTIEIL